jgi:hypothetical protein
VIGCVPIFRVVVVYVARPPLNVPVPTVAPLSMKVTVPVGVPPALATVAVNVTVSPTSAELALDPSVVVVANVTVCASVVDVLVANVALPPYTAVIACEPLPSVAVENVALPELMVPVPSVARPSLNVTVPVGVPPLPLTVAVNVMLCPGAAGFTLDVRIVVVGTPFTF